MQKKEFNLKTSKPVVICVFNKADLGEYIKILKLLERSKY
jgi:hypothetical protein